MPTGSFQTCHCGGAMRKLRGLQTLSPGEGGREGWWEVGDGGGAFTWHHITPLQVLWEKQRLWLCLSFSPDSALHVCCHQVAGSWGVGLIQHRRDWLTHPRVLPLFFRGEETFLGLFIRHFKMNRSSYVGGMWWVEKRFYLLEES